MIKITDQYFWNFLFLAFFAFLLVMAAIILQTETRIPFAELGMLDAALIIVSSWRLTQLIAHDHITKFFREQFYLLKKTARTLTLEKPIGGARQTILDILLSPWSLGLGVTALVTFFYLLTSYAVYPLLVLALSGLVSLLALGSELLQMIIKDRDK